MADRQPLRMGMIHYSQFDLDSRVQRHAFALAHRGDTVDAVCLSGPAEIRHGAGVVRLHPAGRQKVRGAAGAQLRAYAEFCTRAAARLAVLHRHRRFDIVEAHNMPNAVALAALGPKLAGSRVILDVHDTFPELFATRFGTRGRAWLPAVRAEERMSAAMADAVICVTEEARDRLATRGIARSKSHVVMNSPDEAVFGPPRPPVLIPQAGEVRAVYHGGIAPRFGVERLIEAFGRLGPGANRVRLDVHGAFEDFSELAAVASDLAPKRVFLAQAPTPFRRIPQVLADKHIGIVPTLHDSFTELLLPVKLLEYIHMGIPVIASRLPAIENYFDDSQVRFVPSGSSDAIATAVQELCSRPEEAAARAERATQRLAEIRWAHQRTGYLELVDRLAQPCIALAA